MSTQTKPALTATTLKSVEEQASSGHYLDRIIAVSKAVGIDDKQIALLEAVKAAIDGQGFSGDWVHQIVNDSSMWVLVRCAHAGIDAVDLEPIAWAVDYDALKAEGLLWLRKRERSST